MRYLWPCLPLLLAACAAPAPDAPAPAAPAAPAATVAAAPGAQPARICHEDTPTGTRFTRVKCYTAEEEAERLKNADRIADEMRKMRPAARDMSR
jgi:hypothetical protein